MPKVDGAPVDAGHGPAPGVRERRPGVLHPHRPIAPAGSAARCLAATAATLVAGCAGSPAPDPGGPGCVEGGPPPSVEGFVHLYDEAVSGQRPGLLPCLLDPRGILTASPGLGAFRATGLAGEVEAFQARSGPVVYRSHGAVARRFGDRWWVTARVTTEGPKIQADPRSERRVVVLDPGGPCGFRVAADLWYADAGPGRE